MTKAEKKVIEALESDEWFHDWWAGMDDSIYYVENCREAALMFRAEIADLLRKAKKI